MQKNRDYSPGHRAFSKRKSASFVCLRSTLLSEPFKRNKAACKKLFASANQLESHSSYLNLPKNPFTTYFIINNERMPFYSSW